MARCVDERFLAARRCPPQDEHNRVRLGIDRAQHLVGERLPTLALVRGGMRGPYRQRGVEQEHALARPALQVAVTWWRDADVCGQLLVDVRQRRRHRHITLHRETQAVRLPWAVVRILPEHDDPCVGVGGEVQRGEDGISRRIHGVAGSLVGDELLQLRPIRLAQLLAQQRVPIRGHRNSVADHAELRRNAASDQLSSMICGTIVPPLASTRMRVVRLPLRKRMPTCSSPLRMSSAVYPAFAL